MILRKEVSADGVPYLWETNLDDSGIKEFYRRYSDDIKEEPVTKPASPYVIRIPLRFGLYDFRDGFCFWSARGERHIVIYRTKYEWEVWDARRSEIQELRDEQRIVLTVEEQILSTEDNHLKAKTDEAIDRRDFVTALALIEGRISIRLKCERLKELFYLWAISHLWWAYIRFPSSRYGIEFLLKFDRRLQSFLNFAHWFAARCALDSDACVLETRRIYEIAWTLFPNEGRLAKHECLFFRRLGQYELAIEVCLSAIQNGLRDDTKSGFAGRLKRLEIEAELHR